MVRAAGAEFEVEVSFATLNQLLGPFLGLMPQLDPADWEALGAAVQLGRAHTGDPTLVSTATLALLRTAAQHQPVLLVVDDLPWLDKASARVLAFVARRLVGSPIGFLGAARTGEAGLFDDVDLPRLSVAPLPDAPAQTLLDQTFPELGGRVRRRILDDARGNPLALLELPVALGSLGHAESLRAPDVLPVTDRLQAVFTARVAALPTETGDLLLLAALDGTGDLRVLTDPSPDTAAGDGLEALGPAEVANLVYVDPLTRRLEFRHPLTRSAVVAMATEAERRRAHTTLAARLVDDPDRRAWQLAAAALGPEEASRGAIGGGRTPGRRPRRPGRRGRGVRPRRRPHPWSVQQGPAPGACRLPGRERDRRPRAWHLHCWTKPQSRRTRTQRWRSPWPPRPSCSTRTATSTPPTGSWSTRSRCASDPSRPTTSSWSRRCTRCC